MPLSQLLRLWLFSELVGAQKDEHSLFQVAASMPEGLAAPSVLKAILRISCPSIFSNIMGCGSAVGCCCVSGLTRDVGCVEEGALPGEFLALFWMCHSLRPGCPGVRGHCCCLGLASVVLLSFFLPSLTWQNFVTFACCWCSGLLFRAAVPCCCSVLLFRAAVPCCCSVLLFRAAVLCSWLLV